VQHEGRAAVEVTTIVLLPPTTHARATTDDVSAARQRAREIEQVEEEEEEELHRSGLRIVRSLVAACPLYPDYYPDLPSCRGS